MKSSKSGTNDIIYENLYPREQIHASHGQIRHLFRVIAGNQGSRNVFPNEMFPSGTRRISSTVSARWRIELRIPCIYLVILWMKIPIRNMETIVLH